MVAAEALMAVLDTGESKASLVAIRSAPDAHKGIAGQCTSARWTRTREGAPITAPNILETECHRRSSEAIIGHQRSSEVIPSPTILETKCHPVHAQHSVLDDCRLCSTACRQSRSPVAMAAV